MLSLFTRVFYEFFLDIHCTGKPPALLFHSNLKMSMPHYQIDSLALTAHIKNIPFRTSEISWSAQYLFPVLKLRCSMTLTRSFSSQLQGCIVPFPDLSCPVLFSRLPQRGSSQLRQIQRQTPIAFPGWLSVTFMHCSTVSYLPSRLARKKTRLFHCHQFSSFLNELLGTT